MDTQKKVQFDRIVETLTRLKKELQKSKNAKHALEYQNELAKYRSMRDGADGGKFRKTTTSIRDLHFSKWDDSDFQLLLEAIGEESRLTDDEWDAKFGTNDAKPGIFDRLMGKKSKKGRPDNDC